MNVYWDSYGIVRGTSGIRIYADNLKRELRNLGVPVSIIEAKAKGLNKIPFLAKSKIFAPTFNYSRLLAEMSAGTEKVIYHGLSNLNLPAMHWSKKPANMRFVLTVHDLIPLLAGGQLVSPSLYLQTKLVFRRAVDLADAIIAVSQWTADTVAEFFPSARSKLVVIPNGFPKAEGPALDVRILENNAPIKILTVGRGEPYKRHDFFSEVVRVSGGKLTGTIVSPAFRPEFIRRHHDLLDSGRLTLMVNPDKASLTQAYRDHDIYVQTSLFEGFCLPAAEAQMVGLPIVFTKGSGIDEVAYPGHQGGMSAQANAQEWLEKIVLVAEKAKNTAADFSHWLSQCKTWKDSAESVKNLYNQV